MEIILQVVVFISFIVSSILLIKNWKQMMKVQRRIAITTVILSSLLYMLLFISDLSKFTKIGVVMVLFLVVISTLYRFLEISDDH